MFDVEPGSRGVHSPTVDANSDPPGLRVTDPIQHVAYDLRTPTAVSPEPVPDGRFQVPIDTAMRVETRELIVPWQADTYVFRDGVTVTESAYDETRRVDEGPVTLQVNSGPTVLYLQSTGGVEVAAGTDHVRYTFDDPAVVVGVRSYHEDPAGRVTVTEDPDDLRRAISCLGSALKTLGPERSYPTLRGHPPMIEFGDEFASSPGVEPPDTGVELAVPTDPAFLFPISTLAYYLGATVVPGPEPRLSAAGTSWSLGADGRLAERLGVGADRERPGATAREEFEAVVSAVLKHVFVLDCVTRTDGYYPVETRERAAVASQTDVDFESLYDASLAAQVAAYLSVPFDAVAPSCPVWRMTADLVPRPEHAELLPFTAGNLATVRCPRLDSVTADSTDSTPAETAAVSSFARAGTDSDRGDGPTSTPDRGDATSTHRSPPTDAREHVWAGEGIPEGASLLTAMACRRALTHEPRAGGRAVVTVVCNDSRMASEGDGWRGSSAVVDDRLDVSVHENLTVAELRDLFHQESDFLHYIGHADDDGLRCADGHFDARTLDHTGVDSFLLNACRSFTQGRALVERGSVGGLVTLSRVGNRAAVDVGRLVARLLGSGYTLSAASSIARLAESSGRRYVGLGVQDFELVTDIDGFQLLNDVDPVDGGLHSGASGADEFALTIHSYPVSRRGLGSVGRAHVAGSSERYLVPPGGETVTVSRSELLDYLALDTSPVLVDGDIHWSEDLVATLR